MQQVMEKPEITLSLYPDTKAKTPRISVVMAAHNEEEYLPYSLNSLAGAPIDELVIVLDRCTDESLRIVENFKCNFEKKIIQLQEKRWKNPTAEPFAVAAKAATGDIVYVLGADIYADQKIFRADWSNLDYRSWSHEGYPLAKKDQMLIVRVRENLANAYEKLKCRLVGLKFATGVYAYKKHVYTVVQHQDYDAEDQLFLNTCAKKRLRYKFENSRCLHLRPDSDRSIKFRARIGVTDYHVPVWKAVFYSMKFLNSLYFKEYWKTKLSAPI
jgi:glycosyltransferase involved in cell wall biosynthesis